MKSILLISTLFSIPALAGISWVQTPFWQTAVENTQTISFKNSNPDLISECAQFDKYTWAPNGKVQLNDASDFKESDSLTLPGDMSNASFVVELKTSLPLSLVIAESLDSQSGIRSLVDEKSKSDIFPNFTLPPSQLILKQEGLKSGLTLIKSLKSLVTVGESFGVQSYPITMVSRMDGLYLNIRNKSVACDLIAKRAQLTYKGKANAKITLDDQIKSQEFYNNVEQVSTAALSKNKNPRIRAALVGYRLGALLEEKSAKDKVEPQLIQLVSQLFEQETMDPSKIWKDAFGKKILDVTGTTPDFDLTINFQQQ